MEKSKKNKLGIILFAVIFAALLITATFTDLAVSKILVDLDPTPGTYGAYFTDNLFGAPLEAVGSWPVYIMLSFAFEIMFANVMLCKKNFLRFLGCLASRVASAIAIYVLIDDTAKYVGQHVDIIGTTQSLMFKIVSGFVAFAVASLIGWSLIRLDKETLHALLKFAYIVIFAAIFYNVLINLSVKNVMNRPRYRAMNYLGDKDFTNFHRWYQAYTKPEPGSPLYVDVIDLNGKAVAKDAYRSFPSGHTASAAMMYCLLALPKLLKKYDNKKSKLCLYIVTVAFTGVVAVSRIVCGAHFFSDVLVGGTITFVGVWIAEKIFIRKNYELV